MTQNNVSIQGTNYSNNAYIRDLNSKLTETTRQISTGEKAATFGALGAGTNLSLSLHGQHTVINGYKAGISSVTVRTDSMDNAMSRINDTVSEVVAKMNAMPQGGGAPDISQLKSLAKQALNTVQQQLNSKVDGKYIFAGAQYNTAPIADTDAINTNVSAQLAGYGSSSASSIIAGIAGLTEAQRGFDTGLSSANALTLRADDNLDLDYTVKADESPYKNILNSLAVVANLPDYSAGSESDYWAIFNDAKANLTSGRSANNIRQGELGITRKQMADLLTTHEATQATLERNIGNVEGADTAAASIDLNNLTTQLNATYSTISQVSKMSLLNYLN